uniref:Uncharacterized protein n=1 Tax=Arundo donax TaxID=35708 RepID=A0A0A9BNV5_ARUDO
MTIKNQQIDHLRWAMAGRNFNRAHFPKCYADFVP